MNLRHEYRRIPRFDVSWPTLGAIIGAAVAFAANDVHEDALLILTGLIVGAAVGMLTAFVAGAIVRKKRLDAISEHLAETRDRDELIDAATAAEVEVSPDASSEDVADEIVDLAAMESDNGVTEYETEEAYDTAARAEAIVDSAPSPAVDADDLEDAMTRDELYEVAQDLDIDGRSSMNKSELAEAVVNGDPAVAANRVDAER